MRSIDEDRLKRWWSLKGKELGKEYKKMHNGEAARAKLS